MRLRSFVNPSGAVPFVYGLRIFRINEFIHFTALCEAGSVTDFPETDVTVMDHWSCFFPCVTEAMLSHFSAILPQ